MLCCLICIYVIVAANSKKVQSASSNHALLISKGAFVIKKKMSWLSQSVSVSVSVTDYDLHMIMSVIILVIKKSDSHFAFVQFCKPLVWKQIELNSTHPCHHYEYPSCYEKLLFVMS